MATTTAVTAPRHRLLLHGLVLIAGMILAVVLNRVWSLETRWFYVCIAGLTLVSVSLFFVNRFGDFLLVSFLFLIPLAGLQKWLFLNQYSEDIRNIAAYSGALNIGLMTFLLAGFYAHWFLEIFVAKTRPLPRLETMDWLIIVVCGAHVLSIPGAPEPVLGVHAVFHLVEHVLFYFYLSRHLAIRHFRWIMLAMVFAVSTETALGMYQAKTGKLVGLILDKGEGGEELNVQYEVQGIRDKNRAQGTSYDSHAYGLYLNMMLPYLLVWMVAAQKSHIVTRLVCGALILPLALGVYFSYSRASWLTLVIAFAFAWAVFWFWREKQMLIRTIGVAVVALMFAPKAGEYVIQRFDEEGNENLTSRFDMYPVAFRIWKEGFLFGNGAGNYMKGMEKHWRPGGGMYLPVHNVFLWVAADIGLFGVLSLFSMWFFAMFRLAKLVIANREPTRLFALMGLTGMVAFVLDGLTTPLFRESIVYIMLWFTIALSVALPRIDREFWSAKAGTSPS